MPQPLGMTFKQFLNSFWVRLIQSPLHGDRRRFVVLIQNACSTELNNVLLRCSWLYIQLHSQQTFIDGSARCFLQDASNAPPNGSWKLRKSTLVGH